jgi:beta-lactam-binding protein with PASTA domain
MRLPVGSVLGERYEVGRSLGSGAFGALYLGYDRQTESKVAIREYLPGEFATRVPGEEKVLVFKDEKKQKQFHDGLVTFLEEAKKLQGLPSDNGIVQVLDSFSANETVYAVMELLEGETLAQKLENGFTCSADEAVALLAPVISALQLAHGEGIVHGDIAPENIFLTKDGKTKLIDFAASRLATASHSRSLTTVVRTGYSPEEQYRSKGDQGPHTDVYALAAVFYRLIMGNAPPDAFERRIHYEQHKRDTIVPIRGGKITQSQARAIHNALNVRVEDRTPSAAVFAAELSAPSVKRRGNRLQAIDLGVLTGRAKALLGMGLVLVCALVVWLVWPQSQPDVSDLPQTPSLVNLTLSEAISLLTERGLQHSIIGKEYSSNIPADYVLSQSIAPGTLTEVNTVVALIISGGAQMELVPNLWGETEEVARAALEALGFTVKRELRFDPILLSGLVIDTDVAANTLYEAGNTVTLRVSKGPTAIMEEFMAEAPDLNGLSMEQAAAVLEQTKFSVSGTLQEYSDTVPEQHIIRQTPEPGTRVWNRPSDEHEGGLVLVVSLGERTSKVPDIQYKTEENARALLESAGLGAEVSYQDSADVQKGLVISHTPAAGASVRYGAVVSVVVSGGTKPFAAPNVVGMGEAEARAALTGLGLSVAVEYGVDAGKPEGQVLRQSPSSGTEVYVGDPVTLTLNSTKDLISVPNVTGMGSPVARQQLENAGFSVVLNEVYSDSPKGAVIAQSPQSGTLQAKGARVVLTVSLGPEPVTVPNVVGIAQSYAETRLRDQGLSASVTAEYSNSVALGLVIAQEPSGGSSLGRGGTVHLRVSLGVKTDELDDVVGLDRQSAESVLRGRGLRVVVEEVYDARAAVGVVVAQSPPARTLVREGDTVRLSVSLGQPDQVVPDVRNLPENEARFRLEDLDFSVSVTREESRTVAEGYVISQTPSAGTAAKPNSTVTIRVSLGSAVTVPNVVGTRQAAAEQTLTRAGLSASVSSEYSDMVAEGYVISQNPSSGESVAEGSTVNLVVSLGKEEVLVTVPNVVGSRQAAAEQTLTRAGLSASVSGEYSDTVAEGYVISQNPSSGASVPEGSTVNLVVSLGKEEVQVTVPNVVGWQIILASATGKRIDCTATKV